MQINTIEPSLYKWHDIVTELQIGGEAFEERLVQKFHFIGEISTSNVNIPTHRIGLFLRKFFKV